MRFAPHTSDDIQRMLDTIGIARVDELFEVIPADMRLGGALGIPNGLSEAEVLREMGALAAKNRSTDDLICFLGAGAYDHHIPSIVWPLLSRGEFATSYTPYQPELSQGVLQALFEYQTMICELTGMDISNASLYDGASGLAEAVHMAAGSNGRRKVVVCGAINPSFRAVLTTQVTGIEVTEIPWGNGGVVGADAVRTAAVDAAAVVVQQPNLFGCVEDIAAIAEVAHEAGARLIVHFDLITAGVLEAPGMLGADIVVAEGQWLGNHLAFGGPYVGVIACREADVRRLPGRLVGETVDRNGARAFTLTLQAREQHIRREKATSNICTNQTLNALAVAITLSWLGPNGLRELGELCLAKSRYGRERVLDAVHDASVPFDAPVVKEFALRLPAPAAAVAERAAAHGYLAGVPLSQLMRGYDDILLVAVTEKRTRSDIDGWAEAIARACKEVG